MAQAAAASQEPDDVEHIFVDIEFGDIDLRPNALAELERRILEGRADGRDSLDSFKRVADEYQQKVIESAEKTIRLVAPAGSGKTQTIVNRVLTRIRDGLNPERILVLTFDNSAASSLRSTVDRTIGKPVSGLRISTLNSYGYAILREYFPEEHKPVIPEWKPRRLLNEAFDGLRGASKERFAALPENLEDRFYLEFFSLLKNSLFDPKKPNAQAIANFMIERQQAEPFFIDPTDSDLVQKVIQAVIWLFRAYERLMQRDNVLDFDDQKLRAYLLLKEHSQTLRMIQGRLAEVIVDEFQDINLLDFVFIQAISERSGLAVVGDDDQAIYGFRGCSPDFIIDLDEHLGRKATSFELQINYRCPPNIVDHADKLIRHNRRRIPKSPIAYSRTPSQIKVVSAVSASLEAKSIVALIQRVLKTNTSLDFNDFAVLYRTNTQSLPLQIQFVLNDIPYYVRPRDNILANEMLERLLGVLRVKLALQSGKIPTAHDALLALKSYFRFIRPDDAPRLESLFAREIGFLAVLTSERLFEILPKARESHLAIAMQEVARANNLIETLDVLNRRFKGLRGMIGSLEDVLNEKVPLGEIYELAVEFKGNLEDFVRTMDQALDRAKAVEAGKQEDSGVQLLTYFKSKGRQWHTVILTTCNDGIIPHKKAPVEDERRLFYVAMTRASANLVISYVKNVAGNNVPASVFLKEAGLI